MIEFTKVDLSNVKELKEYFEKQSINICDLTVGVRFIWQNEFQDSFAIYNDTLILKEDSIDYKDNFYYPIGKDTEGALAQIENYVTEKNIPLTFCWVTSDVKEKLQKRYKNVTVETPRDWADYIYDAESFKAFTGKKYSGQRNHINKFKKLYPDYSVKKVDYDDFEKINNLISGFEAEHDLTSLTAKTEDSVIRDYVKNIFNLSQLSLMISVKDKCVAFSAGEIMNDTLVVHIEKALVEYQGIYPFIANEFAKAFVNDKVKFINREDDCGLEGLRISKMQYHPIEIREKSFLKVNTLFDNVTSPVFLKTERLTITDITEKDKKEYFELYTDETENKFWGYDYKEDLSDNIPTPEYFYNFQKSLKDKKEEYSLAVKLNGKMIGEIVLHNFDFYNGVEIGFRTLKEYQKKGYTFEALSEVIKYIFKKLKADKINGKCFSENTKSYNLFKKLNFTLCGTDEKYHYFELNSIFSE